MVNFKSRRNSDGDVNFLCLEIVWLLRIRPRKIDTGQSTYCKLHARARRLKITGHRGSGYDLRVRFSVDLPRRHDRLPDRNVRDVDVRIGR